MSGYNCEPCQGANPVTTLITSLQTGQTDCSCDNDLPLMLVGQLALWASVDPQRLYDAVKRHLDGESKRAAKAAAAPAEAQHGPHLFEPDEHVDTDLCRRCGMSSASDAHAQALAAAEAGAS